MFLGCFSQFFTMLTSDKVFLHVVTEILLKTAYKTNQPTLLLYFKVLSSSTSFLNSTKPFTIIAFPEFRDKLKCSTYWHGAFAVAIAIKSFLTIDDKGSLYRQCRARSDCNGYTVPSLIYHTFYFIPDCRYTRQQRCISSR